MNWSENKSKFYFLIILVLIIVILLQKCGGHKTQILNHTNTVHTIDTAYVTVSKEIPIYVPKWHTRTEYIHDTTTVIDTAYVIGDYFSTYVYNDSLKSDTLKLYITDSITQNKIKNRSIKYSYTFPVVTIEKDRNEFYWGFGLVGSKTGINYFGPEFLLRTKNKNVYGVGVGVDGNLQPNLSLRTYWKIGKK